MKYIFSGFMVGAILSLLIFQGVSASELHTKFYLDLKEIENIPLADSSTTADFYTVPYNNITYLVTEGGLLAKKIEPKDFLSEFSSNGRYYIQYEKVGTSIELLGYNGERYWKKKSQETPLLSHNGKLIFLVVGDHSRIRIFDKDGNPAGVSEISGRLCTSIEFSEVNDFGCFGFVDGTYYFLDEKGVVLNSGSLAAGNIVKGMKISSNGKFGVVHYGTEQKDRLRIINISDNDFEESEIPNVHVLKTAVHVTGEGAVSFLDKESLIVYDDDADEIFSVKIPAKRPGQAAIIRSCGYIFLCYTRSTGESQLYVFTGDGRLFYSREFAGEAYLDAVLRGGDVIVRGSDSLFSYRIHVPEN